MHNIRDIFKLIFQSKRNNSSFTSHRRFTPNILASCSPKKNLSLRPYSQQYYARIFPGAIPFGCIVGAYLASQYWIENYGVCEGTKKDLPALSPNFIADAAEQVIDSVVNVTCGVSTGGFMPQHGTSSGSGFIIDGKQGLIATNAHVVAQARGGDVLITMHDGEKLRGRVQAMDRKSDVALVKVMITRQLPEVKIGTSSSVRVGEWVVAVGSPLTLQNTVTCGIVSALARAGSEIGLHASADYIQTDAAINVGNSGGPLVNLQGEVIGVNTLKAAVADGISFAIPIDTAWKVLQQLRDHGKVVRPYIGMKMVTVSNPVFNQSHGMVGGRNDSQKSTGVMVVQVNPGSPADNGGLQPRDFILSIEGKRITTTKDILDAIGLDVGKSLEFKVHRQGQSKLLSLWITSKKEEVQ